ncbi:MAG: transposase, partial [Symbiobacteriaceae bacterium]|nr:transposase [Symbiobacteriaceae bacterium]
MQRAHKIRIYPNNAQATTLRRTCGCARLAYNTCLAQWNDDYANGLRHNQFSIKKWFNSIKKECYPFIYEVSKWAVEAAIADLGTAFRNFFAQRADHPKFHKKGVKDSFRIDGSVIKIDGKRLKLPKGLDLRMAEELRYEPSKIYNVTISERAGMWFVSIVCEIPDSENQAEGIVGVDLGIKSQAVLSDGTVYSNLGLRSKYARQLAHAQRAVARKQKGSSNRKKAVLRLSKLYYRIACMRLDNIHKFTTEVKTRYGTVCLEDLNVSGMLRNHNLSGAIADVSFYEIRRQFGYKAGEVRTVGRFEPTSKTCSGCGHKANVMPLSVR